MTPTAEAFEPAYGRGMARKMSETVSQAQCEQRCTGRSPSIASSSFARHPPEFRSSRLFSPGQTPPSSASGSPACAGSSGLSSNGQHRHRGRSVDLRTRSDSPEAPATLHDGPFRTRARLFDLRSGLPSYLGEKVPRVFGSGTRGGTMIQTDRSEVATSHEANRRAPERAAHHHGRSIRAPSVGDQRLQVRDVGPHHCTGYLRLGPRSSL